MSFINIQVWIFLGLMHRLNYWSRAALRDSLVIDVVVRFSLNFSQLFPALR